MNPRLPGILFSLAALACPGCQAPVHRLHEQDVAIRPNIVLIVAASMGYGDIGPHGVPDIRTPHLDRFAAQSVGMTQFYTGAPICTPARAALITGRYPRHVGLEQNLARANEDRGLSPTQPSIAESLRRTGYATALMGKWHLGFRPKHGPNAHGFDEFFGFLDWSIDAYSHRNVQGQPALYENTRLVDREGYLTDLITERAVSFIERKAGERFFLYVAYNTALPPFQPPGRPWDVRTEATWYKGTREDYGLMVERMDAGIGRILDALERRGIDGHTLVIYTHDHGGESLSRNEPFFHGFGTLWEGGIHVPCFLRWPGRLPPSTVSNQPAVAMDLTATIVAAAGGGPSETNKPDGIDLLPILSGQASPIERQFFWRLDHAGRHQKAVRRGKWKYILDEWNELLFDLEADPIERRDVSYRYPAIRRELRSQLDRWEADPEATKPALSE